MSKPKEDSKKSIRIVETYDALTSYLEGFRDGHFNMLLLSGSWGIGKSRLVKDVLNGEASWIEGNSTAFGIYSTLYKDRDRPIVIDDVDSIYSDRHCVSLLKSICGTDASKRVHWNAQVRFLQREGLPKEFITSSRVMIICNEWKTLNKNVAALEDRGLLLRFEPSPKEVHDRAAAWFKDQEIYDWFAGQLRRIDVHSFRNYIKASQLKACGINWKDILPARREKNFRETLALTLIRDNSYEGSEDRAKAFVRRGGGSRATFFNYRKKLEEEGVI